MSIREDQIDAAISEKQSAFLSLPDPTDESVNQYRQMPYAEFLRTGYWATIRDHLLGCLTDPGKSVSRRPLPDGRGSVTHCKNGHPKQSRDRQGPSGSGRRPQRAEIPQSGKHSRTAWDKSPAPPARETH